MSTAFPEGHPFTTETPAAQGPPKSRFDSEEFFGHQPSSSSALPAPTPLLENLTRCVIEILAGARDLEQISRWVSDDVYRHLLKRVVLSTRYDGGRYTSNRLRIPRDCDQAVSARSAPRTGTVSTRGANAGGWARARFPGSANDNANNNVNNNANNADENAHDRAKRTVTGRGRFMGASCTPSRRQSSAGGGRTETGSGAGRTHVRTQRITVPMRPHRMSVMKGSTRSLSLAR